MYPELNCRNRSFDWNSSLKFYHMLSSLCTVVVIGVNKVNKGIGDKGIFKKYRIANMIRQRCWRRRLFGPFDNGFEMEQFGTRRRIESVVIVRKDAIIP